MNSLLSDQELRDWLGYERPSDVEKFLREHSIKYWRTRGGKIVTTLENVQRSLALSNREQMVRFPNGQKIKS